MPAEDTPWEQICEFRDDPNSIRKYVALRVWMSDTARSGLPPNEIEEKLDWLLQEYQAHMRVHRMRANAGVVESVLVTTAETLENLVTFKWGEMARSLFEVKRRQFALLEAELKSPGREVAYIAAAEESVP